MVKGRLEGIRFGGSGADVLTNRRRPTQFGEPAVAGQGGFTLLELMVVMALIALLVGLVVPSLYRSIKRERERTDLRQLTVALRLARSRAATTRQRVRVFVNRETGSYWLEGSNRRGVLTGMRLGEVRLVWQDSGRRQGYIAFYSDGSSSGGKLAMEDSAGRHYDLEVEMITGKVSLKSGEQKI